MAVALGLNTTLLFTRSFPLLVAKHCWPATNDAKFR